MTYVAVFLYVASTLFSASALSVLVDGTIPSLGFFAVICSLIMVPELFWLIPHNSESVKHSDKPPSWMFRVGMQPPAVLFCVASGLGVVHAAVTFFLFRTFTDKIEWAIPNLLCGAGVFALLVVIGITIAQTSATANRLTAIDSEPVIRRRRKRK
ncbi:hypothetical protein [Planctomycetes bacterium K23_9]|uniref:Uncharacterized protein n=1 Tax=Stieleria marina TaxID=1930275 RepID=A0A517NV91_9BACT|nr:hypothetical protein K239x_30340 [Planctomycetes bacterium K23_9]